MNKISKEINETEAENQASKTNNDTLEVNGNGMNSRLRVSSDENGTEIEENSQFPNIQGGNGTAENSGLG